MSATKSNGRTVGPRSEFDIEEFVASDPFRRCISERLGEDEGAADGGKYISVGWEECGGERVVIVGKPRAVGDSLLATFGKGDDAKVGVGSDGVVNVLRLLAV